MKDKRLTPLGETLRGDFQELLGRYISGWFDYDHLTAEDWSEFRAIEAEVRRFFHIGYEFAAGEAWLTSGFVPLDLAELNNQAGKLAIEGGMAMSPWFFAENRRARGQPSQARNDLKRDGNKKEEVSDSEEAPRPQEALEHHSSFKSLQDLVRLLEAGPREGRTGSKVVHPRPTPGFEGAHSHPERPFAARGEHGVEASAEFGPESPTKASPPQMLGGGLSVPSTGSRAERLSARPLSEEPEEIIPPPFRDDPGPQPGGGPSILGEQGLERPLGTSFEAQQTAIPDVSSWERITSDHPSSAGPFSKDPSPLTRFTPNARLENSGELVETLGTDEYLPLAQQAYAGESRLQVEREPEYGEKPGDASEVDLDQILEAIAQEIEREYRRFYGG